MMGQHRSSFLWLLLLCTTVLLLCGWFSIASAAPDTKDDVVIPISDAKALKKLLKAKTNVLVGYQNEDQPTILTEFTNAATKTKGKGTFALVDCHESKSAKKLCEDNEQPFSAKHYKDGSFNKDYDRPFKAKSFESFILNPDEDAPWEEDETAKDVVHLTDDTFDKVLAKKKPTLVMFYAPWCGHCKRMKPEYATLATELKGKTIIAALDANSPVGRRSGSAYQIQGFPTIKYFENGEFKYDYSGERTKKGLLEWLKNPGPPAPPPPPEPHWSEVESKVNHLTDLTFDTFIKDHPSTLVMFYAPWCGHCKSAKPEYQDAAQTLLTEGINGALAAIDAERYPALGKQYEVEGYPTFWYFKNGAKAFKYTLGRKKDDFVNFLKDPQEPPPPPPPEPAWSEVPSEVTHLTDESFQKSLKNKKHSIVMFYAPWCGHCKAFKPAYQEAAEELKENKKMKLAAVDCTVNPKVAQQFNVEGYPTLKYFSYGKFVEDYKGPRSKEGLIDFFNNKESKAEL